MPNLPHKLTQIALAMIGTILFAVIAGPAFAHYTYRGCDAEGCWRYQCDARGENCRRTPLYGPGHRWDQPNDDYRTRTRGDDWDRRARWRRWECDRRGRWDRWNRRDDCRW